VTNGDVNAIATSPGTVYLGGAFSWVGSYTGASVRIDQASGLVDTPFPRVNGTVYAVAPDGAGGWYLGGSFTQVNGAARSRLAHVLADGRVSAWNPGASGSNNRVESLAVGGGVVYVGGEFSTLGGQPRNNIGAVDAATGTVTAWNPGGGPTDFVFSLTLSANTVYVGGSFFSMGGAGRAYIAAVDATTGVATSWNPGGNSSVFSIALTGSTAYVGGNFTSMGGQARNYIAAVSLTTGLATAWNPNASFQVRSLALDGTTVYAGGLFTSIGGQTRRGLAALDALLNTNNATAWDPIGSPALSTDVYSVAVSGGVVYAGGNITEVQTQPRSNLAAIDAATGAATAWNPGASGRVWNLVVKGGKVFLGGDIGGVGGVARSRLAAFDRSSGAATAWAPGANGTVNALHFAGGRVYVGGGFSQVGGVARTNLAAVDTTGATVTSFTANTDFSVKALSADPTTLYVGGTFGTLGGPIRLRIGASDLGSGTTTTWTPNLTGTVTDIWALLTSGTTEYVGGTYTQIGGQARSNLAAIDTTVASNNALPFVANTGSQVYSLALSGSTLYLGGNFITVNAQGRSHIAAVDATSGALVAGFDPNASGGTARVFALAAAGTTVFAGGDFTTIGGQSRSRIAALDAVTGLATAWNPAASAQVNALVASGNQLFVGGSFLGLGGTWRRGFAAYCLLPAPTGLIASAGTPNTIDLTWSGSAAGYRVYRSRSSGYGYELVGTTNSTAFSDTPVSGGVSYYYVVRAFDQCESEPSTEAFASTTGSCSLPPDFDGLAWARPSGTATCGVDLGWAAASAPCGGGVGYSVHRDTSALVVPSDSNLVVSVAGTSYTDALTLPNTTYYYVVRATGTANGATDANLIRHSVTTATGCTVGVQDVPFLGATATESRVELQWRNPSPFDTVVIHRNVKPAGQPCAFPSDPDTLQPTFIASKTGPVGGNDSYPDTGLGDGVTYCYSVFVDDGTGLTFSGPKHVQARPFPTAGAVKWAYSTGASAMAPPGIGSAGTFVTSNDRVVHGLLRGGAGGGTWPASYIPLALGEPAQSRPPVVPSPVIAGANEFALIGSQDGYAYAVDAQDGSLLWQSSIRLGDMVQAAPMGIFSAFGPPFFDYVLVGTWNFDGTSVFHSLNAATGTPAASFDNGGGATSIGVISSGAAIDYQNSRVIFASRRGGSPNTLWCLNVGASSLSYAWALPLGDIDGSPVLRNGRVYVGSNDGKVYAVNALTGALEWAAPFLTNDGPVKSFVFPDRGSENLYFATDTKVWGIVDQITSAQELWPPVTLPGGPPDPSPSIVLFAPGTSWLYVGGSNGRLQQFDLSGATPVVTSVMLGEGLAGIGAPTLDRGMAPNVIYVGGEGGVVYAVAVPF